MNISKDDLIGLCELDQAEVLAIAEHEHLPEVAAAALANYLIHQEHGAEKIRDMIVDDIRAALDGKRYVHAGKLFLALSHFLNEHSEAAD